VHWSGLVRCGHRLSDWEVTTTASKPGLRIWRPSADAAGLGRFALLGMSQGGPVAIAYATHQPTRLTRLVLYGTYAVATRRRDPEAMELEQTFQQMIKVGWARPTPPSGQRLRRAVPRQHGGVRHSAVGGAGPDARGNEEQAGDERTPSADARRRGLVRRRLLPGPASGAESLHLLADLPQPARPHRCNRRGEAAATAATGGVRAVLGEDVAHRRRGQGGCEDLGDAVDLVARLARNARRLHHVTRTSHGPGGRAARSTRRPGGELPLADPGNTGAPLAGARSVLTGAADARARCGPRSDESGTLVGRPNAAHSPQMRPAHPMMPGTESSVPVTRCRCKSFLRVYGCTCRRTLHPHCASGLPVQSWSSIRPGRDWAAPQTVSGVPDRTNLGHICPCSCLFHMHVQMQTASV
jgi:pimeloyl-ACP methyl ester carboxylesterase